MKINFKKFNLLFFSVLTFPIFTISCHQNNNSSSNSQINNINSYIKQTENKIQETIDKLDTLSIDEAKTILTTTFQKIETIRNDVLNKKNNMDKSLATLDFDQCFKSYNQSLYDTQMGVYKKEDFLNLILDSNKVNWKKHNVSEIEIEYDINGITKDFNNSDQSFKILYFNNINRQIDRFKYGYYEYSIFPFLFKKVYNISYANFIQNPDNKGSEFYTEWLVNEYLPYRDWNYEVRQYNISFTDTTLNSYLYSFMSQINFEDSYNSLIW